MFLLIFINNWVFILMFLNLLIKIVIFNFCLLCKIWFIRVVLLLFKKLVMIVIGIFFLGIFNCSELFIIVKFIGEGSYF